jgi:hypothetical protein
MPAFCLLARNLEFSILTFQAAYSLTRTKSLLSHCFNRPKDDALPYRSVRSRSPDVLVESQFALGFLVLDGHKNASSCAAQNLPRYTPRGFSKGNGISSVSDRAGFGDLHFLGATRETSRNFV